MTMPPPAVIPAAQPTPVVQQIQFAPQSEVFWDHLRLARANTQALRASVASLKGGGTRFKQLLPVEQRLWIENETEVDQGLTDSKAAANAGQAGPNSILDELELIRDALHRADAYWQMFVASPPNDPAAQSGQLDAIDQLLRSMGVMFAYLTVPDRVRAYLDLQPTGGALDFSEAFSDEIPEKEDRDTVLRYLQDGPKGFEGIVDLDTGMIYKASRKLGDQLLTYAITATIAVGGLAATVLACIANLEAPFVNSRTNELGLAYVAVAIGVLVHIGVDLYKQSRSGGSRGKLTAVDDLFLWSSAHQMQMYMTAFAVWAGLVALAFTSAKVEPAMAFIAGYGLDSFLDAALLRFTGTVDARSAAIIKQVAGT